MIDFMVMEAVILRVRHEDEKAEQARKRQEWTKNREDLKKKVGK